MSPDPVRGKLAQQDGMLARLPESSCALLDAVGPVEPDLLEVAEVISA
jgi:hypothetical protein